MKTVIDSLLVTLGLDAGAFIAGTDKAKKKKKELTDQVKRASTDQETLDRRTEDAGRKRQRDADERAKKTVEGYKKIRNEVAGLFLLFTAGKGLKNFLEDTLNNAAGLGFLAKNLKTTTEDLNAWQRASERANGSVAGINAQLKESNDTLAQLHAGMGPNEGLQAFFRFGGSTSDLKDGNTYLLARAKIISDTFKVDPSQAALQAKMLGVSEDQFDFIKQGPEAILKQVEAQKKNSVITQDLADAAQRLKVQWLDLTQSLQATTIAVLTPLLPVLERFAKWLITIAETIAAHREDIAAWVEKFVNADWSGVAGKAQAFANDILEITRNIRGMIDTWDEWTGNSKVKTAGVTKLPGAIRIGKTDDLNVDAAKTGKPQSHEQKPENKTLAAISDGIELAFARTLASFGNKAAGEFVRDKTGKDDYNVGPKAAGASDKSSVHAKLMKMGWTSEQAAGIVGSLTQESGLDPAAKNKQSGAYGIGQWLAPRRADFKAWAGKDIEGSTLDEQLGFQQFELTNGKEKRAGDLLRAAKTAADAAKIHANAYERPGADEANIARRQAVANGVMATQSAAASPIGGNKTSMNTSDTKIEAINIYTQATDAQGIAQALRPAVEKYTFATQANTGMV